MFWIFKNNENSIHNTTINRKSYIYLKYSIFFLQNIEHNDGLHTHLTNGKTLQIEGENNFIFEKIEKMQQNICYNLPN